MANYVKFRRGTPEAFQTLLDRAVSGGQGPDIDTLYFIYEEDESTGELYLGSKLIAGGSTIDGASTLSALQDVLLNSNLSETDCLVYDINKSKWVNKPIADILPVFVGTNGESSQVAGLVPATAGTNPNLFLRSDGKWAEIVTASDALVLQTIVGTDETKEAAIARIVGTNKLGKGDIVVLKELIAEGLYQHTSYAYNGSEWVAMDGDYNAENVYLAKNLTITADVGVQKLDGAGSKELETAGKNLKQVLDMLFAARTLPTKVDPSVSVSCSQAKAYEVGTTVTPKFTATFDDGSYQYAPGENTGVEATAWSATLGTETINAQEGTFSSIVVTDGYSKRIGVIATHGAGVAPSDNLGNVVTDANELATCQIAEGTKTGYSSYISGFRYQFYGSNVDPVELTSENIRNLSKRSSSKSSLDISVAEGSNQVIIAVPASYKVTKVADKEAFGTDIFAKFVESTVSVAGASEGYDTDYRVYVYTPSTSLGKNTYTVSIA